MALFKRSTLREKGLNDEQIEYLMTESGRALAADYMAKADLQTQIDAAVETAKQGWKPEPVNVKESDEYKKLEADLARVRAVNSEDFASIKPKFRETVYGLLDHAEGAKAIAEQLNDVKKDYEEYFLPSQNPTPAPQQGKPIFGAPTEGRMPTGEKKSTLESIWFKK